ncbi:hypothetical protein PV646_28455 [Streptomyces sp. ID05-26A]|nr:hypothetical protein [Streptomyces sp. ID05-26A]
MTTTAHRTTTVVTDNPVFAWRNVLDAVKDAFYAELDADFVHDYRAQLDQAASVLFGPALIEAWAELGYQVTFGPDDLSMQRRPKYWPWREVCDTACARLDPYLVVIKADLDGELLRYAAAHPRTEALAKHAKALRTHTDPLSTELHDRLDAWSETFDDNTSQHAHDQHDGWQAAIDTAVTYAQLLRLRDDLPV